MSNLGSYVRRLVDAGADPSTAAEVSAEIFIEGVNAVPARHTDSHADKADIRREADRLRKQRSRGKAKQNQAKPEANDAGMRTDIAAPLSRDSHADKADAPCSLTVLSSLSLEVATKEGRKEEVTTRARGTRLTSDVTLSPADRQFAVENNIKNPDVAWAEFIDYWIAIPGSRGTKLNWSATWRNRVRQIGGGNGQGRTRAFQNDELSVSKALQRQRESGSVVIGPRPRLLPETGGDDLRLLPPGRSAES